MNHSLYAIICDGVFIVEFDLAARRNKDAPFHISARLTAGFYAKDFRTMFIGY